MLRETRRRSGISQRELARRSGVAYSVISAIETGQRDPSVGLLERLLAALGKELRVAAERDAEGLEAQGAELRQALRLASLLPHDSRAGQPLRYPRLPSRSA